ncbi:MAG: carbohydrate-binding domain-containing protein [Lachnospiraceae bacterium]|nr:carbohydrate-binding domain-containing protein [Lachnospiraceae bacterium]
MKQNLKRRLLAGVLSACMIFQTVGMAPVYAAGNTADCYKEVERCLHKHTAECYADAEDGEATGSNAEEATECEHICDWENGCITKQLDCQHEHEEAAEEIIEEDTELATDSNAQAVSEENIKEVQALIDALPTLEALKEITDKEEQKAIYDDLQTAYEAYKALTKEEQAEVTGAEVFESLFDWFNNQVAIATDVVTYPSWEAATAEGVTLNEGDKITIGGVDYTYKGDGSSTGIALVEGDMVGYNPLTGDLVWKAESGYVLYSYHGTKENPGEASVTLHGAVIAAGTDTALDLPWYGNGRGRDNTGISTTVQLEDENMLTGYIALGHSSGSTTITGNGSGTLELASTYVALYLADSVQIGGAEVTLKSGNNSRFTGSLTVGAGSKLTIGKDATLVALRTSTGLTIDNGGMLENNGTLNLFSASDLTIKNKGTFANNGTIQLKLGTTPVEMAALNLTGSGTVQVLNDAQQETYDTYLKVGEDYYLSGGDKSAGLDLSTTAPTKTTVYQAGSGTALWEPVVEGENLKSGKLTLTDATINASSSATATATAVSLPNITTNVVLNGTNNISANAMNSVTGFDCSPNTTFDLTEGSETTVTANSYIAFVLREDSGNITIKGSGELTLTAPGGNENVGIQVKAGTVNLEGGTLSIQTADYNTSVDIYGSVNLGAITIPAGETLDLTSNQYYPTTVELKGGTVVDGTLVLGADTDTTATGFFDQFSGDGMIKVGDAAYTTDGTKLIISTTTLDFTKTADEGWSATATVEDNGYRWEDDAANGYTLTLGNLNLTAGNPIILPDADVGIVLKGKTTLNAEQPGIYSTGTASGHTVTISGDGSLSTTSENNKGIHIVQNLSITGGTLDMKGRAGGIYSNGDIEISGGTITGNTIESYNGALTISGGTVDVSGTNNSGITAYTNITISGGTVTAASTDYDGIYAGTAVDISGGSVTAKGGHSAIWGRTGITLTGMSITKPAGAVIGDFEEGKAIMLNGKDVLDVTIGEIKLEFKGEGTEASPYEISTAKELADLAAAVNNGKEDYISAHYKLMNNLDLSGIASWTPIGTYVRGNAGATKPFKGSFDGNGKTLRNLKINAPSAIYQGLFGCTKGATIQNLTIEGCNITTGGEGAGSVVGMCTSSSLLNCSATGEVNGGSFLVGGIAGNVTGSTITNCASRCTVSGTGDVIGGVAGQIASGSVENCFNAGTVAGSGNVGGVVGRIASASCNVRNCYNTGTVIGNEGVGGVAGVNLAGALNGPGKIEYCYSVANAVENVTTSVGSKDNNYKGGLVGANHGIIPPSDYGNGDEHWLGVLIGCGTFETVGGNITLANDFVGETDKGTQTTTYVPNASTTLLTALNAWVNSTEGEAAGAHVWALDSDGDPSPLPQANNGGDSGDVSILMVIDTAINKANAQKENISINDKVASQVANGTKFVTAAEMDALNTAIQTAIDAKVTVSTLAEAQAAAAALDNAVGIFKAAIKTGTYISASGGGSSSGGSSGGSSSGTGQTGGTTTTDQKKGQINSITGIITGANITTGTPGDGYSHWQQEEKGWKLQYADGTILTGTMITDANGVTKEQLAWELINGAWYAFGADGYAKSGLVFDPALNGWFYIDINSGMKTGWQFVEGKWRYFNPLSDGTKGKLAVSTKTPDGYDVDQDGVWNG